MSTPGTVFEYDEGDEVAVDAQSDGGPLIDVILRRARSVLAATPLESGDYIAHGLWGHELAAKLADPRERERLYLLDVRSREAYDSGHIEGAHHVAFSEWASEVNLRRLPLDRKIIVICETGMAAAQVVAGLRMLGYDAAVPRTGINGWSRTAETELLLEEIAAARYPVKRVPPAEDCHPADAGAVFDVPDDDEYAVIAARMGEVFGERPMARGRRRNTPHNTISAAQLHAWLQDQEGSEEIFLVDLRREEDFEGVGHIEGSLRLDFDAAMVPANLARLPRDGKIVTVCYTGNLAAQLAAVLRLLGYDAHALAYGMVGWTRTPSTHMYLKDIQKADNPLV